MLKPCIEADLTSISEVINDGARAYHGVIPAECWHEPYMPIEALRREIDDGVRFLGYVLGGSLVGVMGLQELDDIALIRHAYVRTQYRNQGIGGRLLAELKSTAARPLLVGTWSAARWAILFYEKHGFHLAAAAEKDRLLSRYWRIPAAQASASVVLSAAADH